MADSIPIGACVSLQRGTTYKSKLLGQSGPVLLGLASIARNGGFRTDKLRRYSGESPDKLLVRPGELFVSLKDVTQSADLLGSVARVPPEVEVGRLTQDTVKLVPTGRWDELGGDYIYWCLRTPQYREYCRAHSTGTTNLGLARDDFLAFPLPAPTAQKRAAVAALQALDDKIELNRKMNQTLEEMAQAIFKSWFIDFDGHTEFVDSELGRIPKGWRVRTVKDVCSLVIDCPHSTPEWTESGVIVLRTTNFKEGMIDLSTTRFTDLAGYEKRIRRAIPTGGDIIITREAPMGLVGRVPENVRLCMGQRMVLLRANPNELNGVVLYRLLRSPDMQRQILWHEGTGSTVSNLRIPALKGLQFASPDAPHQVDIARRLQDLEDRRHLASAESLTLTQLRDTLLPKLISGELRVPEIDEAVENVA